MSDDGYVSPSVYSESEGEDLAGSFTDDEETDVEDEEDEEKDEDPDDLNEAKVPDADDDDNDPYIVSFKSIPRPLENVALEKLATEFGTPTATFQRVMDVKGSSRFLITSLDSFIYGATKGWVYAVKPRWEKVSAESRLYTLCKFAVFSDGAEITLAGLRGKFGSDPWKATLKESMSSHSWANLILNNMDNADNISRLIAATSRVTLDGGEISGNASAMIVMHKLTELFPEFAMAAQCVLRVNICQRWISGKQLKDDRGDVVMEVPVLKDLLMSHKYGTLTPGIMSLIDVVNSGNMSLHSESLHYLINRLCELAEYLDGKDPSQSVFSPIAKLLKTHIKPVPVGQDAIKSYGSFFNKNAMLSFMLACNEIEIIKSCISLVKTLIGTFTTIVGQEEHMLIVVGTLLGYKINEALLNPLSPNNAPMVYSRISVTNLGSLAAVWLATHDQFTYKQLLETGYKETETFLRYSGPSPFVQAVLCHASMESDGGMRAKALITCEQVRTVFSTYALSLVATTSGYDGAGTPNVVSETDQQFVTTLFYGALSSTNISLGDETMYLSKLKLEGAGQNYQDEDSDYD